MSDERIGVQAQGSTSRQVIATIQELEEAGIPAAWMPTGSGPQDSLTLFAGAASLTKKIVLGTGIVPTYPRHPIVAVQQTHVINEIAPGRFILGIGASHKSRIEGMYKMPFKTPLNHTREYLHIVRTLLHTGSIEFDGKQLSAHVSFGKTIPDLPVMISALRRASFELAGAESDGAISWVCPADYLQSVALPAMKQGTEKAGRREVPPLVAHAPICVHENKDEIREAVNKQLASYYLNLAFYKQMFVEAGYPEAESGVWSDGMLDAVVPWGREEKVADGLKRLFDMGASEVIVTIVLAGSDKEASYRRGIDLIAQLVKEL